MPVSDPGKFEPLQLSRWPIISVTTGLKTP
jgi:hypothetical protein